MLKRMCLQMRKKNKGFTLIELIVVIAILGILAAILIPQFSGFQDKATSTQVTVDAKQLATAADGLIAETGGLPAQANAIKVAFGGATIPHSGAITTGTWALSTSGNHVVFELTQTVDGTAFTAERDDNGKITVTW
ncbi:MAG: prepilin-type N-terminal cleavage/methylation domain-containing protein [Dehalobacter sp. 4CP]|nr:prepilin-type N-terminal cleavage/methylation domain-containing protein [Dehalobacter sp. 4CP]